MKKNSEGFIQIIVILIIIAIVGFGAYYFGKNQNKLSLGQNPTIAPLASVRPTADPFAGWKTYTNTTYKYSLKYPPELFLDIVSTKGAQSQADEIGIESGKNGAISDKGNLEVNMAGEVSQSSPKWWTDAIEQNNSMVGHGSSASTIHVLREFVFQGMPAIEVDEQFEGPLTGKQTTYWVSVNDKILRITVMFEQGVKSEVEGTFNQILSTFKFTK